MDSTRKGGGFYTEESSELEKAEWGGHRVAAIKHIDAALQELWGANVKRRGRAADEVRSRTVIRFLWYRIVTLFETQILHATGTEPLHPSTCIFVDRITSSTGLRVWPRLS
jgi:hypothetical protein